MRITKNTKAVLQALEASGVTLSIHGHSAYGDTYDVPLDGVALYLRNPKQWLDDAKGISRRVQELIAAQPEYPGTWKEWPKRRVVKVLEAHAGKDLGDEHDRYDEPDLLTLVALACGHTSLEYGGPGVNVRCGACYAAGVTR